MTTHAVVIAGGGPTGLMLAAELALPRVDVAIVERRPDQVVPGRRAGGLHARTIELLDQRGIADRFLSQGKVMQVTGFALVQFDIGDFPTRRNYGLALRQEGIERALAAWVDELAVPIHRGLEVSGFAQDETGVDVELSDGRSLRAQYLVGCDGGRSLIRKKAGIDFPGWDPSIGFLIAEADMAEEPPWGFRPNARGVNALGKLEDGTSAFTTSPIFRGSPMRRGRLPPTERDECSWPATRRTCMARWADRDSTSASRTR
jgi:3-(3-hydroxy-phenyl)propionate hydroxylase